MTSSLVLSVLSAFTLFVNVDERPPSGLSTTNIDETVEVLRNRRNRCGPISLWYYLNACGISVDYDDVERQCDFTPSDGMSIKSIEAAANEFGAPLTAYEVPMKRLDAIRCPCILITDSGKHAVTCIGFYKKTGDLAVLDPAIGQVTTWTSAKLTDRWSGVMLAAQVSRTRNILIDVLLSVPLIVLVSIAIVRTFRCGSVSSHLKD